MSLQIEAASWVDSKEYAQDIVDRFTYLVNANPALKIHRDYIEEHAYGFGERAFHWLWKLIVDEMPDTFSFLEIGVYKGQVLSLVRLLANLAGKHAFIHGVTLLSSFSGNHTTPHPDENYAHHICCLHDHFKLEYPAIIEGDSTNPKILDRAKEISPFDIIYVDGCHEYAYVEKDLMYYPPMIKPGGLLVVDDSANFLKQPWGFFQGINDVSVAVKTIIETNPKWEHLLAVMHNRVWRNTK